MTFQTPLTVYIIPLYLKHLEKIGIQGIVYNWFESYPSNRSQKVCIVSSLKFIALGVLQGSVLGPILYLVHINDLSSFF